jgi:hypothetical protein
MNFGEFIPIVAIASTAWVIVTLARLRNGNRPAPAVTPAGIADAQENARLTHENESYRLTI